jgi:Fe-Mn family superoxide dismutase
MRGFFSFAAVRCAVYRCDEEMGSPKRSKGFTMSISLPPLPYPSDALEPHISVATVRVHHDNHEAGYVDRVNTLIADTPLANQPLEAVIASAPDQTLFNMAAQAWSHAFYWRSLHPRGGGLPRGAIAALIERDFGGYERFAGELRTAATSKFGSGWAWVVLEAGQLKITATSNADLPASSQTPLLVIDVWEHAYYLDYQYRRAAYVAAVLGHLLNWDHANERLEAAAKGASSRAQLGATAGGT